MNLRCTERRNLFRAAAIGWLSALVGHPTDASADDKPMIVEGAGGDFPTALHEAIKNAALTASVPDGTVDWKLAGVKGSVHVVAAHRITVILEIVKR